MKNNNFNLLFNDINKIMLLFKQQRKYLNNTTNFKYEKKTTMLDGLSFLLLKTEKNSTQESVKIDICMNTSNNITRQSLIKRSDLITYNNLYCLYNKLINKFNLINSNDNFTIFDGGSYLQITSSLKIKN